MIKINLLPVKAAKRRADGQRQLLVGAIAVTTTIVALIFVHTATVNRIESEKAENKRLEAAIAALKKEIGDYDIIKAQREELIKQRDAIKKLQANRSGPVWMMRELSDILTAGKGPTINKEAYEEQLKRDPNAGFNPNWEPKRVWLLDYAERAQRVTVKGAAKSDEDVAEFLKRLKQSAFFSDVYWQGTQPQFDAKLNVAYVTFDVTCKVNY
jgi:type IV pilus assembly protein PilN